MTAYFAKVKVLRVVSMFVFSLTIPLAVSAAQPWYYPQHESRHPPRDASPLVDKVRKATARFRDINVALGEGWVRGTPCVSSPQSGAMGVHFILPSRVFDGALNASEPEALIYEPQANGSYRFVGVEFIVIADEWAQRNPGSTPSLDGHLTNLVSAPNRYGLPSFYELHVWAWQNNPNDSFTD